MREVLERRDATIAIFTVLASVGVFTGYMTLAALTFVSDQGGLLWYLTMIIPAVVAGLLLFYGYSCLDDAPQNHHMKGPGLFLMFYATFELGLISCAITMYAREAPGWQWGLLGFSSFVFTLMLEFFPSEDKVNTVSFTAKEFLAAFGVVAALIAAAAECGRYDRALFLAVGLKTLFMAIQYNILPGEGDLE